MLSKRQRSEEMKVILARPMTSTLATKKKIGSSLSKKAMKTKHAISPCTEKTEYPIATYAEDYSPACCLPVDQCGLPRFAVGRCALTHRSARRIQHEDSWRGIPHSSHRMCHHGGGARRTTSAQNMPCYQQSKSANRGIPRYLRKLNLSSSQLSSTN